LVVDQVGVACHTGDHSCFDADVLLGPDSGTG
jgi:phosphoribosyl-AMP cyclohydrolase